MPLDQHLLMLFAVTTIIAMIVPGPDMLFVRMRHEWWPAGRPARHGRGGDQRSHPHRAGGRRGWPRCSRRCRSPSPWCGLLELPSWCTSVSRSSDTATMNTTM